MVVGEPNAKKYLLSSYSYPWKSQKNEIVKRVIWSPHFSIIETGLLHRACFIWMAEPMKEIAKKYEGQIQFVLKPHPFLISSLYAHPNWGKERTDQYFDWWRENPNTQVETGAFIDLFMTSDALIHDCGSFTAEYLYTKKPVLFAAKDFSGIYTGLNYFGTRCLDLHYKAQSLEDVLSFLDNVVLGGNDSLNDSRQRFYQDILVNETAGDVGQNIYNDITQELFCF